MICFRCGSYTSKSTSFICKCTHDGEYQARFSICFECFDRLAEFGRNWIMKMLRKSFSIE